MSSSDSLPAASAMLHRHSLLRCCYFFLVQTIAFHCFVGCGNFMEGPKDHIHAVDMHVFFAACETI